MSAALDLLELDAVGGEPLAVRIFGSQLLLDFPVVVDLALKGVHKQDLSWLETALGDDVPRFEVHHSHLGSDHHHSVSGDGVTGWPQSVPVKQTACITAVGEHQGGRAVPRLHQDGVIFIESLEVFADRVLVVERLRNEDAHGLRKAHAAHHEKLERIVQTGGVGHLLLENRFDFPYVTKDFAGEHALPRLKPSPVASDGVDFTIVAQETEGLCKFPLRECIGRETGMDKGETAGEIVVAQVRIVSSELSGSKHSLVDDVLARKGADVEIIVIDAVFNLLADLVENPVEVRKIFILDSGDKNLLDVGLHFTGTDTQGIRIGRDIAEVHEIEADTLDLLDNDGEDLLLSYRVLREEDQTGTVAALLGYRDTLEKDELVRNLKKDSCAVSGLVACLRPTVLHVLEHLQCVVNKLVRLCAMYIDNHSYSARIVLVGRCVQSLNIH